MLSRMRNCVLVWIGLSWLTPVTAAPLGPAEVAVVFNTAAPDSEKLAKFYCEKRQIPAANLIGLKAPVTADITRAEFETTLRDPLRLEFEKRGFWRRTEDAKGTVLPVMNKIRVLVTIRGIPLRIKPDPKPKDFKDDSKDPITPRDEASVDSELSLFGVEGLPSNGVLENKYFKSEKPITEAAMPYVMLTARIDAASTATCERMITDAVETEVAGLWGMAYVDIANKFPQGDDWLKTIAEANLRAGIPTVVDRFTDTLPTNYPMTAAALYYGWYDWNVSGPFLNPKFSFRKGAVAMHLHSFSAQQLTDATKNWCAPLLLKGAAATIGNVYEPYLHLTHHFDILHQRLLAGFSVVEAAWMAIPVASWQAIVLGDPLYRPFAHFDGNGPRIKTDSEFMALRMAALKWGDDPDELRKQLQEASERLTSGVISEAIGLRLVATAKPAEAVVWFNNAKRHYLKPEDKMRQDFNIIATHRALPGSKPLAVQALREAKVRYGAVPEATAFAAWLDILDPPPPPPADPTKTKPQPNQ
jgi:uncharacterized protein (TIGR03790 family)